MPELLNFDKLITLEQYNQAIIISDYLELNDMTDSLYYNNLVQLIIEYEDEIFADEWRDDMYNDIW